MKPVHCRMLDSPKLAWSPLRPITQPCDACSKTSPGIQSPGNVHLTGGLPAPVSERLVQEQDPVLPEKGSLVGFFCPHSGTYTSPPSSPRHTLERYFTEKGQSGVLGQADLSSSPSSATLSLSLSTEQLLPHHHFYYHR